MTNLKEESSSRCFGGYQKTFSHDSTETKCKMTFSAYIPENAEKGKCPVLYWLSGLTCTEQNFIIKSGFQRYANEFGFIVIGPDTSPRGCNVEGESESWDFGVGAGFYLDATVPKWETNWRMGSYVTRELPALVNANFPVSPDRACVSGHSMGGHGALVSALRNPTLYRSVSAFAPISNPSLEPWGIKAFTGYLGEDRETWRDWDATYLVGKYQGEPYDILIDIGTADQYVKPGNLLVDNFVTACAAAQMPVSLRRQEGYDHSFFFVSTFLRDHFAHHATILGAV